MASSVRIIHLEEQRKSILEWSVDWIRRARLKSRVELRGPARTSDQNRKMWAMLTDIVVQEKTINGQQYDEDQWKCIFMEALGHEPDILPKLSGRGWFPVNTSTSKLSIPQMAALIDFIYAWGAENSVVWSDPELGSYIAMMH